MNVTEISLIGVALAMDATIYAFSYGLVLRQKRRQSILLLALTVGLFQFAMPLIGYWGGHSLCRWAALWAPWVGLAVFSFLGGTAIFNAWFGKEDTVSVTPLGGVGLLVVGVATSIDALAVGLCMAIGCLGSVPSLSALFGACALIGGITFVLPLIAFSLARLLHRLPTRWLQTLSGLLLIALGVYNLL